MEMKKLKIAVAFLLPFILGILIFTAIGNHIHTDTDIEPFFTFWLIFCLACSGFTAGTQYPLKPFQSGVILGISSVFIVGLFLIWLAPIFIAPLFLLALGGIIIAITGCASFLGAVIMRARAILARERETGESDQAD
jgi:hypothetical protein